MLMKNMIFMRNYNRYLLYFNYLQFPDYVYSS